MVHIFRCAELNLMLDVESGALHVLSDEASAVARLYLQGASQQEIQDMLPTIEASDIKACIQELEDLKASGLLDTPEETVGTIDDGGIVKSLCLHVAHDCNLRCGYCFASTGDFTLPRVLMPFEVGKAALDFLMEHSGNRQYMEVDFFGGEPMMNFPVVKRIVQYGRELEQRYGKIIRFTLTTNCYDVPEDAFAFCNEQMHNLVLSIDGRKEVHNAVRRTARGGPTYETILHNALAMIKNRGNKEYYARGTFTRRNIDFVPDAQTLWDAGFEYISIEPVVLASAHPLSLREEDLPAMLDGYDRLVDMVIRRKKEGKHHHFYHFMVDLSGGPCLRKRLTGCGAGREYMAVTPEGTLYPCHQFVGREGFVIGDVFDGIQREDIRDMFRQNHVLNKPQCQSCFAKYYCSGGCAANAHAYSGNLFTADPLQCELMKKRTECALALAAMDSMDNQA